jgi:hypothetical protein
MKGKWRKGLYLMGMREEWKIVTGGNDERMESQAVTGGSEVRVHKN